jgi:cytochrome c5
MKFAKLRCIGCIMALAKSKGQIMKARALALYTIAVFFVLSVSAGSAFGQFEEIEQRVRFEIPYEFTIGSKVLPAGTYTFSADMEKSSLRVQSGTSVRFAHIIYRPSGPAVFFRDGSLVFDKTDGSRILSEVWISGTDGLVLHSIPKNHRREVLLGTNLDPARKVSGRAAYNLTCGRCHGPDGKGDQRADKFFNITIPRLSSAEVQGKSDEELRKQITEGDRVMPPVEIDESGFRHRLPPQDVDAVIAYMRTLKR